MTYPITPNPGIHISPKRVTPKGLTTKASSGAMATAMIDAFLAQVLYALAGIQIAPGEDLGDIFPQLQTWAQQLQTDAQNALTGANTSLDYWSTLFTDLGLPTQTATALSDWLQTLLEPN